MATIYVYKFKDNKLDVFEAETTALRKEDGSFYPVRSWGSKDKCIVVKYTKYLIYHNHINDDTSKGISQYDSKCTWIMCVPGTIFRNILWFDDFDLKKAVKCFVNSTEERLAKNLKEVEELRNSIRILCNVDTNIKLE